MSYISYLTHFCLFLFVITPLKSNDVDDILAQYYEALGGLDKLREVQSLRLTGSTHFQNQELMVEYTAKRPNFLRIESAAGEGRLVRGYNGGKPWMYFTQDPAAGVVDMEGQDAVEFLREADFDGPLIDYREKGHRIDLLGREEVNDREAYKLKLVEKGGSEEIIYIDVERHIKIKQSTRVEVEGGYIPLDTYYSEFRKVDGLLFPLRTQAVTDGKVLFTGVIHKVELNPEVNNRIFREPD